MLCTTINLNTQYGSIQRSRKKNVRLNLGNRKGSLDSFESEILGPADYQNHCVPS